MKASILIVKDTRTKSSRLIITSHDGRTVVSQRRIESHHTLSWKWISC